MLYNWVHVNWCTALIAFASSGYALQAALPLSVRSYAPEQIHIIWEGFNVTGSIHMKILGGDGHNCADFWWVVYWAKNIKVGKRCDTFALDVHLSYRYGQLRMGGLDQPTVVALSDQVEVAAINPCQYVKCPANITLDK